MKSIQRRRFLLLLLASIIVFPVLANNHGVIMDKAGVLSDSEEVELQSALSDYEKQSKVEMAALIIDSLNGADLFDYNMKVSRELGIGKTNTNNGALILLALKEHKIRINVGYGLEWAISDEQAEEIIRAMVPALKESHYAQALKIGFNRLKLLTQRYTWDIQNKPIDRIDFGDVGKVFSFRATYVGAKKLPGGTVSVIKTENGQMIQLNITNHMTALVGMMQTKKNVLVTGRIIRQRPLVMELMGVGDYSR